MSGGQSYMQQNTRLVVLTLEVCLLPIDTSAASLLERLGVGQSMSWGSFDRLALDLHGSTVSDRLMINLANVTG